MIYLSFYEYIPYTGKNLVGIKEIRKIKTLISCSLLFAFIIVILAEKIAFSPLTWRGTGFFEEPLFFFSIVTMVFFCVISLVFDLITNKKINFDKFNNEEKRQVVKGILKQWVGVLFGGSIFSLIPLYLVAINDALEIFLFGTEEFTVVIPLLTSFVFSFLALFVFKGRINNQSLCVNNYKKRKHVKRSLRRRRNGRRVRRNS